MGRLSADSECCAVAGGQGGQAGDAGEVQAGRGCGLWGVGEACEAHLGLAIFAQKWSHAAVFSFASSTEVMGTMCGSSERRLRAQSETGQLWSRLEGGRRRWMWGGADCARV